MGGGEGRITGQPVILNAESREFHCGQGVRLPGGIRKHAYRLDLPSSPSHSCPANGGIPSKTGGKMAMMESGTPTHVHNRHSNSNTPHSHTATPHCHTPTNVSTAMPQMKDWSYEGGGDGREEGMGGREGRNEECYFISWSNFCLPSGFFHPQAGRGT